MNKILLDDLCSRHKVIWMSISDFTDLLKYKDAFIPITDRDILVKGLYGHVGETKLCVTRYLATGSYSFAETIEEVMKENGFIK